MGVSFDDELVVHIGRPRTVGAAPGSYTDWRSFEPLSYEIDLDLLELADAWTLRFPFDRDIYEWTAPDSAIEIVLNGRPICSGLVDDRKRRVDKSGSFLDVNGRDKGGRLVDSAAPMVDLTGLGILDLARKMVTSLGGYDLFPEVVLQNATNRRLIAGGGRTARVSSEPAIKDAARYHERSGKVVARDAHDRRIRPGQTRAQVLEDWLEEAGLLGWSSADGRQFVVGKPNYAQQSQFALFAPAPGSRRRAEGNVLSLDASASAGERYARIIVIASGKGTPTNYGENIQRRGVALQGPNADGTGGAFRAPKDLIIVDDDQQSQAGAKARAEQEMALRESTATQVGVVVLGHSQPMGNEQTRANYAPDTMVRLEDEETGEGPADMLITRCQYSGSKMGRTTRLTLVPRGTDLRMTHA